MLFSLSFIFVHMMPPLIRFHARCCHAAFAAFRAFISSFAATPLRH
jgi:hypothetical protein